MFMRRLIIEASRIAKIYRAGEPDEVQALRDVNLRICAGDFLAILGPEGAGKTTLLRILGLLDRPTSGDLFYEGRLVTGLTDTEMAATRPSPEVLRLVDDPVHDPVLLHRLQTINGQGLTVVLATGDPEVAAHGKTLYRLHQGSIYQIGG